PSDICSSMRRTVHVPVVLLREIASTADWIESVFTYEIGSSRPYCAKSMPVELAKCARPASGLA
ncbi:hypothetical protein, partial [Pantoea agglomerans]|uniref:hypothetical protein n=1 Tax=Enterobacter agglomerans TaxID=549 RepID=UPI001CA4573F